MLMDFFNLILFIYLFIYFSFEYIWFTMLCFRCPAKWFSLTCTCIWASHLSQLLKNHPAKGDLCSMPGLGSYAQRDMTNLSSILAWRISWTEEPSRLHSIGSQRVWHIWINWACTGTHTYIYSFTNLYSIYVFSDILAESPVVLL